MGVNRRQAGAGLTRRGVRVANGGVIGPTFASLDVSSGTELGGTTLTAAGTRLTGTTGVTVNGVAATSVTVVNDTTVTFVTPAATFALSSTAASNAKNVVITTPSGSATLTGGFTYISELARIFTTDLAWEGRASDPAITLASGAVTTLPDFTGNGNAVQATSGRRPAWSATGQHGGPAMTGTNAADTILIATLTAPLLSGTRPYMFMGIRVTAFVAGADSGGPSDGSGNLLYQTNTAGHFSAVRAIGGTFTQTDTGVATNNNYHRIELGYTASGTAFFVMDGTPYDSAATGTPAANLTLLELFGVVGTGHAQDCVITDVALIRRIPTGGELTAARSFFTGANFPGYTGNTYV